LLNLPKNKKKQQTTTTPLTTLSQDCKLVFKLLLEEYHERVDYRTLGALACVVGLGTSRIQFTLSLKRAWLQPYLKCLKFPGVKSCFQIHQLVPLRFGQGNLRHPQAARGATAPALVPHVLRRRA
jgi:hypothetical protein